VTRLQTDPSTTSNGNESCEIVKRNFEVAVRHYERLRLKPGNLIHCGTHLCRVCTMLCVGSTWFVAAERGHLVAAESGSIWSPAAQTENRACKHWAALVNSCCETQHNQSSRFVEKVSCVKISVFGSWRPLGIWPPTTVWCSSFLSRWYRRFRSELRRESSQLLSVGKRWTSSYPWKITQASWLRLKCQMHINPSFGDNRRTKSIVCCRNCLKIKKVLNEDWMPRTSRRGRRRWKSVNSKGQNRPVTEELTFPLSFHGALNTPEARSTAVRKVRNVDTPSQFGLRGVTGL